MLKLGEKPTTNIHIMWSVDSLYDNKKQETPHKINKPHSKRLTLRSIREQHSALTALGHIRSS